MKRRFVTRLIAVTMNETLSAKLKNSAIKENVIMDSVAELNEVIHLALKNKYHAVIVDMAILRRNRPEDASLIVRFREIFRIAKTKLSTGSVDLLILDEKTGRDFDFKSFCHLVGKDEPRQFRAQERKPLTFNVEVCENKIGQEPFFSHTINVSQGGCFIYCTQKIQKGEKVIVKFRELSDKRPVICRVVWSSKGGDHFKIPGIGVCFEEISEKQQNEIIARLSSF